MGNNTTKISHPMEWAPIDPSPDPSSSRKRSPRAHFPFPTIGTSLITGTLPRIIPANTSTDLPVEHLENPYETRWTDWAYVPRIIVTRAPPDVSYEQPPVQDRKFLSPDDIMVLEPGREGEILKRRKEGMEKRIQAILGKASEMTKEKLGEREEIEKVSGRIGMPEICGNGILVQEVYA